MKSSKVLQLLVIFSLVFAVSCAPSYFGKTYAPTQNVDVYLDAADVRKPYTVMGTSDIGQGFSSMDAVQNKVIELGKSKGADGVIMKLTEETTGSSTSNYGTVGNDQNKKKNTYNGGSVTNNIKVKKVQATFVKYN